MPTFCGNELAFFTGAENEVSIAPFLWQHRMSFGHFGARPPLILFSHTVLAAIFKEQGHRTEEGREIISTDLSVTQKTAVFLVAHIFKKLFPLQVNFLAAL